MKLSGSNYGMPTIPLDEALAFHAAVGYRAIEITVLPTYLTALERLDRAARQQLRARLRQHDLICSGIANFENLTDPDPSAAAATLARHRGAIDLAAELATDAGTPVLAFMSGGSVADWPAARERLIDRVGELAEYAHQCGVTLAMKAHANGCVSRPHHLVDLLEQIGSPSFRFCFDMSHYEVQGLSIEQALFPLLPLSAHVEVKASIGRAPTQEYMIPGEPNVQSDFVGQFRAMRRLGYDGYLVPEMSVHVMRRPTYDPYSALRLAYAALTSALQESAQGPRNRT